MSAAPLCRGFEERLVALGPDALAGDAHAAAVDRSTVETPPPDAADASLTLARAPLRWDGWGRRTRCS